MSVFSSKTGSDLSSRIKPSLIIGSLCVAVVIGILVLMGIYQTQNHPTVINAPVAKGAVIQPISESFSDSSDNALSSHWAAINQVYTELYPSSLQQAQVNFAELQRSSALDQRYGLTNATSPIDSSVAHWNAMNNTYRAHYGAVMDQEEADFATFTRSEALDKRYGRSRP